MNAYCGLVVEIQPLNCQNSIVASLPTSTKLSSLVGCHFFGFSEFTTDFRRFLGVTSWVWTMFGGQTENLGVLLLANPLVRK